LSGDEQLRFRRHLERLWNVYRHRMAPPVAQAVDELQSSGIFFVHAGEVDAVEDVGPALHLQVKLRARARLYAWRTDWLVNCTGPDPHLFERGQPLMDALLARGLARPGPFGMGVGTDERGRVLDAQGQPSPWLWAVGPLRQGQLLESTAVPEIRVQARDIALDIDRSLADLCTGSTDAPAGACRGSKAQPPTAQLVAS
jgi:hydroxyacylglutathione hydrolase